MISIRSVASQIFAASVVVVAGTLLLVWLLTASRMRQVSEVGLARELATTRVAVEGALAQRSASKMPLAAGLTSVPTYFSRVEQALARQDLATLLDQAEEYRDQLGAAWTMLLDQRGTMSAWTLHPERTGEDFSEGALVRRALGGDTASGAWLEPSDSVDHLYQSIAVPIRRPGGQTVEGSLIAAFALDDTLLTQLNQQTGSEIALVTLDTLGRARLSATTLGGALRQAMAAAIDQRSEGGQVTLDAAGSENAYIGSASALRTAGGDTVGLMVGLRSRREAMAAVEPLRRSTWLGFGAGLLLALVAGLLISRRIASPIRQLVKATQAARDGDYSVTLPGHGPREVGELAGAFQGLMDDLRAKEELVGVLQHERHTREMQAAAGATLEPGAIFANRYQIVKHLGTGGMGTVYRATDRELGETVALKALRAELVDRESGVIDRFREEIRLARRISHRNVVRTHDLGVVGDVYYLTMEYMEGRALDDVLTQEGRLPAGAVRSIGVQMLRALDAAHEVGVIHRDIKPPNLLIDRQGLLKITDFGIARLADETTRQRKLTATGMVVGTPAYMAPEQLAGDDIDVRADIYAAGAVLYECLTGKSPHDGLTLPQLFLRAQQDKPAPDPREIVPEIPATLAEVVRRALSLNRDKRFATAREMLAALEPGSIRGRSGGGRPHETVAR